MSDGPETMPATATPVETATAEQTVLLLGATGRTGGRVLTQLLGRGVGVRAVVRSAERLPADAAGHSGLTVVVADLPSLSDEDLAPFVRGCDAIISCLGHTTNLQGVFGAPRDLVRRSVETVCRTVQTVPEIETARPDQPERPSRPVKLVLMSSVSVHRPGGLDVRRGWLERAVVWILRGLVPPARDNQRAADFLSEVIGTADPHVEWASVRPDSLLEGDISEYALHEGLVDSLFRPGQTTMANVAHFMCELVTDPEAWAAWQGKLPVIVNASPPPLRSTPTR